nr:hypothetical protein [Tanacetum cinerariifolium]
MRIQPLPYVQGKGKEKVIDEQAAHDLLTLQTPKKKSHADQFVFQRRTPMPNEPSGYAESPSLDEEVLKINAGDQDKGRAGPNPGKHDESQAGSNPGDAAESQPQSSHMVHAGPNLEHMDLEATDASTQQNYKQMDEEFTTTAYPNVHENLKLPSEDPFLVEKPHEEEPKKTNTEFEVQSMVTVPIHHDTSSVPPMTTPVIDLAVSQPVSITVQAPLPTSTTTATTITTTTTLPPPPPYPQQSTTDSIVLQRIGELEKHIADLLQNNLQKFDS